MGSSQELGSEFTTLADLSGDGILDFVALTPFATVQGAIRAGAVHLWAGGDLSGAPAPTATLVVDGPALDDQLGVTSQYPRLATLDLSGDGVLDVVTASWRSDPDGATDAGAIYVWNGGSLAGEVPPSATLTASSSTHLARYGLLIEDLDGDGALDIGSASPEATVGGMVEAGAVYVWSGSGGFAGDRTPTLEITGSCPSGALGRQVRLADLDGDDQLDLLVAALHPRLYFWRGGATIFGATEPTATLEGWGPDGPFPVLFRDWDGDGFEDVAVVFHRAVLQGVLPLPTGLVQVWRGGALSGTPAPVFTLFVPGSYRSDPLATRGLRLGDLTGDGLPDLLGISPEADASADVPDSGAIYLWSPRHLEPGRNAPFATLRVPDAGAGDLLGEP